MRQLAWLHATPKPPRGSKRHDAMGASPMLSRLEQMKEDKIVPQLPRNPAPLIIQRWREIGPVEAAGTGTGPISWQSIHIWQQGMRLRLDRWEARLIRKLSIEYLAEGRRAESENCPPPLRAKVTERQREVELDRLRMVLG